MLAKNGAAWTVLHLGGRGCCDGAEWSTLHLRPGAPVEVVEAAYRALALLYHPDRGGDTDRMQEINAAIEGLRRARGRRAA